jgi:outer membrane protein OmpA-like peptidoglycan-associated protein
VVASIQGLFFDTDSHEPQPAALPDIVRMADMILLNPNHRYRLIGYADVRGGAAHNQRLSLRRAERVRELLLQNGVPATQITAVGRGAITTAKQNSSTTLQQNRRVDLESIL